MPPVTERVNRLRVVVKGRFDAVALRRRHPSLAPGDETWCAIRASLASDWEDYVRNASDAEWAVSLETATYLYHLCRAVEATRLLDTGSGFSSYVFRRYARDAGTVSVVSTDDDPAWLGRTEAFLRTRGLSTDGLVVWPPDGLAGGRFDVVFHDLAFGPRRVEAIPLVLSAVRPGGGVVVLDDGHHYGGQIFATGRAAGLDLYSLRARTLDDIGRYAVLGVAR